MFWGGVAGGSKDVFLVQKVPFTSRGPRDHATIWHMDFYGLGPLTGSAIKCQSTRAFSKIRMDSELTPRCALSWCGVMMVKETAGRLQSNSNPFQKRLSDKM